jgi:hypothetical protein
LKRNSEPATSIYRYYVQLGQQRIAQGNGPHDRQQQRDADPVFGFGQNSGTFSAPGGFSNVVYVTSATNRKGIWGGTKNIAATGAMPAATGSILRATN